jgi:hypothetical protein
VSAAVTALEDDSTQADPRSSYSFRERDSVSAAVTALEDDYTDADFFETICQIRGDNPDGAGTHELVHHIHGEATPDE